MSLSRIGLNSLSKSTTLSFTRTLKTSTPKSIQIPFLKQLPQPPGFIVGTVNDAYIPPKASKSHGSYHWNAERLLSVGLVPLCVVPFVTGSFAPAIDATLSSLILAHSFLGFQGCIIDYIPRRVYGVYHNYAMYLLSFGTVVAGYGIYSLEQYDVGLTGLFTKLWNPKTATIDNKN